MSIIAHAPKHEAELRKVFENVGDTLKKKMSGVISSLDDEKGSEAQSAAGESSAEQLKSMDDTGI